MAPPVEPISLETFIDDIERLLDRERRTSKIAEQVCAWLPRLLAEPAFLTPECCEPDPDHYRSHVLAVTPSGRASVVALIWLPGQVTPIHDHISWCVVGVLQGLEREERFSLRTDGRERWLAPVGEEHMTPGQTCSLVPPSENIHRVRNAGQTLAISIHVYGANIEKLGSSINACFDELPLRSGDPSGEPVAWRCIRSM
jgi:3-mercaptopropionate dioxygenase